jgi:hypothetical protein
MSDTIYMRILHASLMRGFLCSCSNMTLQYEQKTANKEMIARSFIYGMMSFPVLFHTYAWTKRAMCIQPHVKYAFLTSFLYELFIWPITALPLYFMIMYKDKKEAWKLYRKDVGSITIYSAFFWVPFTALQTRFISLQSFAPVRLSVGFLYNCLLQRYASSSSDEESST